MSTQKYLVTLTILGALIMPAATAEESPAAKPEKIEIRHSMLGYRSTLVFYTFAEQRAVLVLGIDNKDETFPLTATVHLFDQAETAQSLAKWVNNQSSDALFADAPKPVVSEKLPPEFGRVKSHKLLGTGPNPGPEKSMFKDFEVEFSIAGREVGGRFKIPAFTDTARVHVPSK